MLYSYILTTKHHKTLLVGRGRADAQSGGQRARRQQQGSDDDKRREAAGSDDSGKEQPVKAVVRIDGSTEVWSMTLQTRTGVNMY
jgi:hypothetical protein